MSNGSARSSLPSGWVQTTVREVFTVVGGGTPSTSVATYWNGGIPWITSADIDGVREIMPRKTISEDGVRHSATNVVPAHTIIVVTRVGLGKIGLTDRPLAFSQDCQGLISDPTLVDPGFAAYQLLERVQTFKYEGRGTTISGVTKKQLLDLPFHLAPYAEQRRIVATIEEHFSRIDSALTTLQSSEVMLRRYRAVILDTACFGSGVQAAATLKGEQRSLPSGGKWMTVGSAIQIIDYRGRTPPLATEGIPHVRTVNIRGGKLLWNNLAYVSPEAYSAYMTRGLPRSGDLLFTTEAPLGEVTQAPDDRQFSVAQRVMILRPNKEMWFSPFLMYQLMSPRFQQILHRTGTGTTVTGVSSRNFRTLPLYAPPLPQQESAVAALAEALSLIEDLQRSIDSAKTRARRLRSSILQQAFRGCLVPPDRSDEPATILLDRIKSARVSVASNPRRRSHR